VSRYRTAEGAQAETEPGSHGRVLRNRLGIVRKRDMDRAEYEALVTAQELYLTRITQETRFTAALLCEMHWDWLGEIYEWAGTYRTVEMQKGGFTWPPAYLVPQNMAAFETEQLAAHTPCRSASVEEVSRRIAEVHAELLLVHPFREGNGRLARWLADLMALQAGYPPPDYAFRGRGAKQIRAVYLGAVQRGYLQDYGRLTAFFRAALERRLGGGGEAA
jgi:cell filamentation protein